MIGRVIFSMSPEHANKTLYNIITEEQWTNFI